MLDPRLLACVVGALAVWAALPGCGSSNEDIFGAASGGSTGKGGGVVQGGGAGQGGGSGGTAHGGAAGSTGKGGTGIGGSGTGGSAEGGSAGQPGSGGMPNEGGAGGTPPQGGAAGTPGQGGASGAADCGSECSGNYCNGADATSACNTCIATVCAEAESRYDSAPGMSTFASCTSACSDNTCWQNCCNQQQQACSAYSLWGGCACGFNNSDCSATCSAACGGGGMDTNCQNCVWDSPCSGKLYDYYYVAQAQEYSNCRNGCNGDATCMGNCCSTYAGACAARGAVVACACN